MENEKEITLPAFPEDGFFAPRHGESEKDYRQRVGVRMSADFPIDAALSHLQAAVEGEISDRKFDHKPFGDLEILVMKIREAILWSQDSALGVESGLIPKGSQ